MFLCLCFVVSNRASRSRLTPSHPSCRPYADKLLSSEPIFAAYVDNFLSEKTIIPFPVSQRIEEDDSLCQQTIPREIPKILSSQFESPYVPRSRINDLTILKSNIYEKFLVKINRCAITRSIRLPRVQKKIFLKPAEYVPELRPACTTKPGHIVHATCDSGSLPIPTDWGTHRAIDAAGKTYSLIL